MEILISDKQKVYTDEHNWIYAIKYKNTWEAKWFYPDLKACYIDLLEYFVRISDKEKLIDAMKESIEMLDKLKKEISN